MKEHIAILSHHPGLTLSYARVAREVGYELERRGHSVTWLGLAPPRVSPASHRNALLLPGAQTHVALAQWLRAARPNTLLTIGDPWMFNAIPRLVRDADIRWHAYFPVDGRPLPEAWHDWIHDCDRPLVYSQFAADVVEEATGVRPAVAYHGVDLATFTPLDRTEAKRQVGVADHFVVGTVAANQQRKNLPALVDAFARFAHDKPDALLYLHAPLSGTWDLPELVRQFHVGHKTHFTERYDLNRGVDERELVTIYNSFDVFVLPTMAEGFGLPIVEAQACGVPVLATDYSACPELLPDDFCRLTVLTMLVMNRNLEQAVVDVADIAAKLEALYHDRDRLTQLAHLARTNAANFTWQACVDGMGI